jgi:membrane-associated phospholipid phosphatase
MNIDTARLRQLDLFLWTTIAAAAVVVLAAPLFSDFRLNWMTFGLPLGAWAGLIAGVLFYELKRPDARLASALSGTGQIIAFSAFGAPLSYLAASAGRPLQDSVFDAADRMIALDWRALLEWMNQAAFFHPAFSFAYQSFTIQASVVVLWLSLSGRLARLRTFILAFMIAAFVSIAISALVPAQGVWGHYGLGAADHSAINPATRDLHLAIFHGLRDGSFRQLTAWGSQGIITFPSMHAAVAVILAIALWPVPVLRWIAVGVNIVMVAATPVDGGHYFIDVAAGIMIAVASWFASAAFVEAMLADPRRIPIVPATGKSRFAPGE